MQPICILIIYNLLFFVKKLMFTIHVYILISYASLIHNFVYFLGQEEVRNSERAIQLMGGSVVELCTGTVNVFLFNQYMHICKSKFHKIDP